MAAFSSGPGFYAEKAVDTSAIFDHFSKLGIPSTKKKFYTTNNKAYNLVVGLSMIEINLSYSGRQLADF